MVIFNKRIVFFILFMSLYIALFAQENMVRINGGTFLMGSPANDPDPQKFNLPQHRVTLSSYYIGKYEVTQKEWTEIMGTTVRQQQTKSKTTWPLSGEGNFYPIYFVTWYDAIEYCNKKSIKEGLTPVYTINRNQNELTVTWDRKANGYRLPTEAEWEYACRAGTTTTFSSGSSVNNAGWHSENANNRSHSVGEKQPNPWGLYDMHGNVFEWCWDLAGDYTAEEKNDPINSSDYDYRIYRGGSWFTGPVGLRTIMRYFRNPNTSTHYIGFRVARNVT